jgi:hypothetical protein
MLQDQLEKVKEDIMNPCQNNCQHGCCNFEKSIDLKRGENHSLILIAQCLNTQGNILDYGKLENYKSSRTFVDKEFSMNFMKFQHLWLLQML